MMGDLVSVSVYLMMMGYRNQWDEINGGFPRSREMIKSEEENSLDTWPAGYWLVNTPSSSTKG